MNGAASYLATRRELQGVVHNVRFFYRKKGGARELSAKKKKGLSLG